MFLGAKYVVTLPWGGLEIFLAHKVEDGAILEEAVDVLAWLTSGACDVAAVSIIWVCSWLSC